MLKRLVLSCFLVSFCFSEEVSPIKPVNYNFLIDPYFSPYAGGDDLLFGLRCIEEVEDWVVPPQQPPSAAFLNRMGRAAEIIFGWWPVDYLAVVTQHEVFGHGYRVRSLSSASGDRYSFGTLPPYGPGGAATAYHINNQTFTLQEETIVSSGGVEATAILATRTKLEWLQKGNVDPRESILYMYAEMDLANYIHYTDFANEQEGNDMQSYVKALDQLYPDDSLSTSRLKKLGFINYLDPFFYYSIYGLSNYIITGTQGPMPMIPICNYGYLFGFRLGLTPFGPEYYMDNFLVKDKVPIYFYVRGGEYASYSYYGGGVEQAYLFQRGQDSLGYRIDVWYQPYTCFNNSAYSLYNVKLRQEEGEPLLPAPYNPSLGISGSLILKKRLWSKGGLFVQVGGKTAGYVPGEVLSSSWIGKVGITVWE